MCHLHTYYIHTGIHIHIVYRYIHIYMYIMYIGGGADESIRVWDDALDPQTCQHIIELFEQSEQRLAGVLKGGQMVMDHKAKKALEVSVDALSAHDAGWAGELNPNPKPFPQARFWLDV